MRENVKVVDVAQLQLARRIEAEEQRLRAEIAAMDRGFFWMLMGALVISGAVLVEYWLF